MARDSQRKKSKKLARPERLELPTLWFEARCSIQLSYGRAKKLTCTPLQRDSLPAGKRKTCAARRRGTGEPSPRLSSHGAYFFRLDFVEDADFARLPEGINGLAQILLRKLVDVIVRAVLCNLDDTPANFQVAVRIRRILQRNRYARVAPDIFVLDASQRRIKSHIFSVVVHPNGSDLRAAVFHERAQIAKRRLLQKVRVLFGNVFGHHCLPRILFVATVHPNSTTRWESRAAFAIHQGAGGGKHA